MSKKIKAIFRGDNGSCGYNTDKEYTLIVSRGANSKHPFIDFISIKTENENGLCDYESIEAFLNNWDNIRNI